MLSARRVAGPANILSGAGPGSPVLVNMARGRAGRARRHPSFEGQLKSPDFGGNPGCRRPAFFCIRATSGCRGCFMPAFARFCSGGNRRHSGNLGPIDGSGSSLYRKNPTTSIRANRANETTSSCFRSEKTRLYSFFQSAWALLVPAGAGCCCGPSTAGLGSDRGGSGLALLQFNSRPQAAVTAAGWLCWGLIGGVCYDGPCWIVLHR